VKKSKAAPPKEGMQTPREWTCGLPQVSLGVVRCGVVVQRLAPLPLSMFPVNSATRALMRATRDSIAEYKLV
jgi:hypothetical protein